MFRQGLSSFSDILLKNKVFQVVLGMLILLIILLFSSFSGRPIHFAIGIGLTIFLAYCVLNWPKGTLFALIFFRMLLDYPSENFYVGLGKNLSVSFSQAVGAVIFVAGAAYLIKNREKIKLLPLKLPLLIYFIFSGVTIFYSVNSFSTFKELLRFFDLGFLFFLSFTSTKTKKDFVTLLKILFFSSLIPVFVGISQFFLGIGYTDSAFEAPRIFGTFSHPNSFSLILSSLAVLAVWKYLESKEISEKIWIIALESIYLFALILTFTRIGWLALLLATVVIGFLKYKKLLAGVVLASLLVYLFVPFVQERMRDAVSPQPGSSLTWRKVLWKDMIDETLGSGKQYIGYGVNTFEQVAENKRGIRFGSTAAHNDFVKSFLEGGYLGLVVYVFFLGYLFVFLARNYRASKHPDQKTFFLVMLALFLSLVFASLSDNIIRNTPLQWIFWIVLGAGLKVYLPKKI
jgi:putative inorganic carbon (hco3(-)) transporter